MSLGSCSLYSSLCEEFYCSCTHLDVVAYFDADYTGSRFDQCFTTGYCTFDREQFCILEE